METITVEATQPGSGEDLNLVVEATQTSNVSFDGNVTLDTSEVAVVLPKRGRGRPRKPVDTRFEVADVPPTLGRFVLRGITSFTDPFQNKSGKVLVCCIYGDGARRNYTANVVNRNRLALIKVFGEERIVNFLSLVCVPGKP